MNEQRADPIHNQEWRARLDRVIPCHGTIDGDKSGKHDWSTVFLLNDLPAWWCAHCGGVWNPDDRTVNDWERLAAEGATLTGTDIPI